MRWLARGEEHLPGDHSWLSDAETAYANAQRFTKRRVEFLVARWTAKQALCHALSLPAVPGTLRRLEVRHAPSGAPLACFDARPVGVPISLTDRAGWAVCVLGTDVAGGPDVPGGADAPGWAGRIGCDLELVEPRTDAFVDDYLTATERRYVAAASGPDARQLAANLIWSAKESGLKVLTTGLRRDTRSVEVTVGAAPSRQGSSGQEPDGWAALTVRTAEGDAFPGWWRRFGAFVLTVAAERAFPAPAGFDDPPLLSGAEPTHSWLRRPETAQQTARRVHG
jgi:4'-phosphopantetheinyl transferase